MDKHHFYLDIHNETKQVSFSKRLYFNKPSLPIGFIDIKLNDRIKFQFSVLKGGDKEDTKQIIQEYVYEVRDRHLKGISDNCNQSEDIPIKSWIPALIGVTLNYDGTTQTVMPVSKVGFG